MIGFSVNWSVLAVAFSCVASGALYGLRRQVRDARRLGQYTLTEKLGEGGMGVVYRASVGYYMLAGSPMFEGRSALEVCAHHMFSAPAPPSERLGKQLPADLEAIVLRCLAKSPAERFQSASELLSALMDCADAGQWTSVMAQGWWNERGSAPAPNAARPKEVRTVEIDAAARAAVIDYAGPTAPIDLLRDR